MKQHSKSAHQAGATEPVDTQDAAREAYLDHCEQLMDSALMDTFPASDPVSPGYFN